MKNLNIQALRAIAALSVVVGHASHETVSIASGVGRPAIDLSLFNWGIGVDIFFVLSGYVMLSSSAELFGRPGSWKLFLIRRITRIVPLYWLLTTIMLIGAGLAPKLLNVPIGDWRHVVASYLFIPSARTPEEIRPVMALGWTLNMEMFFYVVFACALALPLRFGIAMLTCVMVSLATVGIMFRPEQVQIAFWTQPIILEFLFGCLLALFSLKGVALSWRAASGIALLGVAGGFVGSGAMAADVLPNVVRWGVPALLIVAAAALSPASRSRATLGLAALGDASYCLYLIHPFILRPFREVWMAVAGGSLPLALYIACALLVAILASLLLFALIERPILHWLQKHRRHSASNRHRHGERSATIDGQARDHESRQENLFNPNVTLPTVAERVLP